MKSRIDDIPKLKTEATRIDGHIFNQACLALSRLDNPLRIKLPGLRGMDILMDGQAWACVDRSLYDLPVLAWTDFVLNDRRSLHEPVDCVLHFYHIHADLIGDTILDAVHRELTLRLRRFRDDHIRNASEAEQTIYSLNLRR
jgi:hypothetical protein